MKTFRIGGIHPPENKLTAGFPIVDFPVAEELRIMLSQSIGAPSKPVVKAGDTVERGSLIAEAGGFVSAPLHSPVKGTVKKIEPTRTHQGIWQNSIVISPSLENQEAHDSERRNEEEIENLSPQDLLTIIGDSGIVGLGGATFPTRVKLTVPKGKKAAIVLLNGAECEPYLTCDDALMREKSREIVKGMLLIMKTVEAQKGIIGIESNKPEAIKKMSEAIRGIPSVSLIVLKKKYPQGSEKQLIYAMTRKVVPAGGLPIETGCIVDNVATAFAVYDAVYNRNPLTGRIVTIAGEGIQKPGNYRILNGTPLSFIMDQVGGLPENVGKLVAGGPMMGRTVSSLDSTATKGMSGLITLGLKESERKPVYPCIRCGKCITVCPMGLEPYLFMQQAENRQWEGMQSHGVMNCLECGCCSYSCPANRPLLDMIKLGKINIRALASK